MTAQTGRDLAAGCGIEIDLAGGETLRALRMDPNLSGAAGAKMTNWTVYQTLLRALQRRLDTVVELLEAELGDTAPM